jgi:hypothetical protein
MPTAASVADKKGLDSAPIGGGCERNYVEFRSGRQALLCRASDVAWAGRGIDRRCFPSVVEPKPPQNSKSEAPESKQPQKSKKFQREKTDGIVRGSLSTVFRTRQGPRGIPDP